MDSKPQSATLDRAIGLAASAATLLVLGTLSWILLDLLRAGLPHMSWSYITSEPEKAGRAGGISTVLISTGLVLAVCLSLALPMGIGTAVWLSEYVRSRKALARLITISLDLLASVPSIIFGLFGMIFFSQLLGLGFSILSGGLTLGIMILPIIVQTTHAAFRSVPAELRSAAAALGLGRIATLRYLLLPSAMRGVTVGMILGIGRALAETAALLFTSGYVTRMPESLLDSGRTLSVHVYDLSMNVTGGRERAAAAALVLLVALLLINLVTNRLSKRWLVHEA